MSKDKFQGLVVSEILPSQNFESEEKMKLIQIQSGFGLVGGHGV